ncbi:MAG: CotH kinase family protein [Treponema sp.]|nr:CotH kinase family protein [Treponema sp.]
MLKFFVIVLIISGTVLSCDIPEPPYNPEEPVNYTIKWDRPLERLTFPSLYLSVPAYEHGGFIVDYRPDGTSINLWPSDSNSLVSLRGAGEYNFENAAAQVRSRGNSTWRYFVKRPLRFRFYPTGPGARSMFGSSYEAANWTLIANAMDYSLMRTYLGLFLGESLGSFDYNPMHRFVHLYMAGEYRGLYMFSDHVERLGYGNPGHRIQLMAHNQSGLPANAPHLREFLLEWCRHPDTVPTSRSGEAMVTEEQVKNWVIPDVAPAGADLSVEFEQFFWSEQGIPFEIGFPENTGFMRGTTAANPGWRSGTTPNSGWAFVRNFINLAERTMRSGDEAAIRQIIDIETFVDFYLVNELFKNHDVAVSSVRFQIKQVDNSVAWAHNSDATRPKLFAGPLWDFDQTAGGSTGGDRPGYSFSPVGAWAATDNLWLRYLMSKDWFKDEVRLRWNHIKNNEVQGMLFELERIAVSYQNCFERNFKRWDEKLGFSTYRTPSPVAAILTWKGQVEYLDNWFRHRMIWMDEFLR